ncbi:MAG TPA: D-alanyl-D-alanine carboxypeptidase, partial [Nocardioides sp.]|nr:D-alanyl-D-alanine carboxypeptidase [Nocardioides sp.]
MRMPSTTRTTRSALGAVAAGALLLAAVPTASAVGTSAQLTGAAPAATTTAASVAAYAATTADTRMASALTSRATSTRFGTSFSGAVVDAASDATIWSKSGTTARMPASTNKLVTASNALTLMGPDKRFTTRVRSGSASNRVI